MSAIKSRDQILLLFIPIFLRCLGSTQARFTKEFDLPFDLNSVEDEAESLPDPVPTPYLPNEISKSSDMLTNFLLTPWPKGVSPFLYVEKPGSINDYLEKEAFSPNEVESDSIRPVGTKRSKYYRKYPWKRQQANIRFLDSFRGDSMKSSDSSFIEFAENLRPNQAKRGYRYRKCPARKRQKNVRYEPAYMCIPGKDDIYRLLVALHGERDGPRGQLVDFCNRKRPASFVFTNIRYVG